jgi:GrpB-like predicted nucleotidyltransferase (UPF0157 family)
VLIHGVRLGLPADTVELVPYDDRWPALYESEAALLRAGLQGQIGSIAHIGSTSILGMHAKPIIDLMVSIASLRAPTLLYWALGRYGYALQADDAVEDRLFFVKETHGQPTHHLSACEPSSEFWSTHLAFRDRLRADPALANEYVELKQRLWREHSGDRLAYTAGKADFITAVLHR